VSAVASLAPSQPSRHTSIRDQKTPSFGAPTPPAASASATGFPIGSWTQAAPRSIAPGPSGSLPVRPPVPPRASCTTAAAPAHPAGSPAGSPATPARTTISLTGAPPPPARSSEADPAAEDLLHHLVGAAADRAEPRVAQRALDPVLAHVAVPTVDLQALV